MEAARNTSQEKPEKVVQGNVQEALDPLNNGKRDWVKPDSEFVRRLSNRGGSTFLLCMQCGTCSATCAISPDIDPFPRKELAWARWGMKDRLLSDTDIWLCYQCNDCSARCPRGARPGEVLGAIREECVDTYAFPSFFGRWVNQPQYLPLLLGIPIALLTLALFLVNPIENALGITKSTGSKIMFSYSNMFPHWLLNTFFAFFSLLALLVIVSGIVRFWRAMKKNIPPDRLTKPAKGFIASILSMLKNVFAHTNFDLCTTARSRYVSHLCIFFGFLALFVVSIWVITAGINPLIRGHFIYPFGFWSPWEILANIGGVAVLIGCLLIIRDRFKNDELIGAGSYFDWALISILLLVVFTGFTTEVLHYLRLEPHRHLAYFVHLVFAFMLLIYLPYSKLAHLAYRSTAMVFAEFTGRTEDGRANGGNTVQKDVKVK
jgi:quinone-modifying oxidoreductase subunit QmoC